jgi:hypothetical protein
MSDGPSKSLNMPRAWRRVARSAEIAASSSGEIKQNLRQALVDDSREIPPKLISALRKAFGDGRQKLLGLNEHERFAALRSHADGSPLGALLLSHATMVAHEGWQGEEALREATLRTLRERVTHGARQVAEHHYRGTRDGHSSEVRERIEFGYTD